jgi:hypothetical protein
VKLPAATLSRHLSDLLRQIGAAWAVDASRPRIQAEVLAHWNRLIAAWAESDLPLAIRKSEGARGEVVAHRSGRLLIYTDNSPAQWAFMRAHAGDLYTLDDIARLLDRDEIPFSFATKSAEKTRLTYRRTLGDDSVNKRGWKLCHVSDVGLGARARISELPLDSLKEHFRKLMSPGNHFLIPLAWGGLGEVDEVIDEIRRADRQPDSRP